MPWVKVLGPGNPITPKQIKEVSPNTKVVYRRYRFSDGGPDMDAPTFFRFVDADPALWSADYFVILNEWDDFRESAAAWHTTQMKWAYAHPENYLKRLLVPGWSTGNPGGDPMDTYLKPHILKLFGLIRDLEMLASIDEYDLSDGDWDMMRFLDHVWPKLPPELRNHMPNLFFGEIGKDRQAYQSEDALYTLYQGWNGIYRAYSFVVGGVIFMVGNTLNTDWDAFNVAKQMTVFESMAKSYAK